MRIWISSIGSSETRNVGSLHCTRCIMLASEWVIHDLVAVANSLDVAILEHLYTTPGDDRAFVVTVLAGLCSLITCLMGWDGTRHLESETMSLLAGRGIVSLTLNLATSMTESEEECGRCI